MKTLENLALVRGTLLGFPLMVVPRARSERGAAGQRIREVRSAEDLAMVQSLFRASVSSGGDPRERRIIVRISQCSLTVGADKVLAAVKDELRIRGCTDVVVKTPGCIGLCEPEPIVEVSVPGLPRVMYGYVTPEKARRIVAEHVLGGRVVHEWVLAPESMKKPQ